MTRQTGPDAATRTAVYERALYLCEKCSTGEGPFAVHHRRPRGMGSTRRPETNGLAALVLLCETCHLETESHRTEALQNGWLVRQHQTPAETPLLYRGRWVLLTDDGSVENTEKAS